VNGTCGGCLHWVRDRTDFVMVVETLPPWNDEQEAEASRRDLLYGRCEAISMGPVSTPTDPLAVAMDGSGFRAEIYTLAEFGCVLFKGKADG